MLIKDVTEAQISESLLNAAGWFFSISSSEEDSEIVYFEKLKDWATFNVALKTPWVNFFSGWVHKELDLEEIIDGATLERCLIAACDKKLEELNGN